MPAFRHSPASQLARLNHTSLIASLTACPGPASRAAPCGLLLQWQRLCSETWQPDDVWYAVSTSSHLCSLQVWPQHHHTSR